jgi:hypothetical protein
VQNPLAAKHLQSVIEEGKYLFNMSKLNCSKGDTNLRKALLKSPLLTALAFVAVFVLSGSANAYAQSLRWMSCDELWYERNAIYADAGYCFKTQRARSVFGRRCYPPYGNLSPSEKRRVSRIEEWEYRKGCR